MSALESLLFAKYQMYRNVYWHHAVRSRRRCTSGWMEDALHSGRSTPSFCHRNTDEGLLHRLEHAAPTSLLDR